MKATRLICVAVLALALAACGDSSDNGGGNGGDGGGGAGGVGGDGGNGGTGGALTDQCTNEDDQSVYEDIGDGDAEAGQEEVAAIANECADLGGPCTEELGGVLVPNPSDEDIQALVDCVVDCTEEQAALSSGCLDCYGNVVTCGANNCASECGFGTQEECDQCLVDNDCTSDFEDCSGLTSTVE